MNSLYLTALIFWLALLPAWTQPGPQFAVRQVALPPELADAENQFSGLATSQGTLWLLSESRLQDQREAKLYAVPLADIDRHLADTTHALPYRKLALTNLALLRAKMEAAGQHYEGLEALLVTPDAIYFTVETDTPSRDGYLLRGRLEANAVVLDTAFLVALTKPLAADGQPIYNAGFEALARSGRRLLALFEYNSFPGANHALDLGEAPRRVRQRRVAPLPFRLTDMTPTGGRHFTALNFFFAGPGPDAVYRPAATDQANNALVQGPGGYTSYSRLLDLTVRKRRITWRPLWEFPAPYRGYNWEGIAAYKGGYLVINDKYTPARPYRTTLLYLQRK